ncbi:MAG: hypothetical protein IPG45_33520 [Deltaproteobacteria bacterium]|nr:hypothetical protein [Deltaproteobacteria bacterium]
MKASAPGKLVLLGDYAVLAGGPALVAAVDRRAVGAPGGPMPPSAVVEAVLARAKREGGRPELPEIDTRAFLDEHGQKLGLGSSAAVAVVTAALSLGQDDERTFQVALEGHRDAAGGVGSGVDVAASFYGGVIATARQPAPVEVLPTEIPGLTLSVLYTGQSASTARMVEAVERAEAWLSWQKVLLELSEQGLDAWRRQDAPNFLSVVSRYGRALAGLGADAGVPIVTHRTAELMRRAQEEGGAAKPSGAGGGDVAVLFASDPDLAARLAVETGCVLLSVRVDPRGLRLGEET